MKALFGGTFNPPHNGHIALALEVLETFHLDRVEFVPSFLPVHRDEPAISAMDRQTMVERAIRDIPGLAVNPVEIERGGSSYTVETLEMLARREPDVARCWLMGADAFNGFGGWKQPHRILELANLIVCARPGFQINGDGFEPCYLRGEQNLADFQAGRIAFVDMSPNPCSSTRVRGRLTEGQPVTDCLSPAVLDFIQQNHLYGT